MPIFSFKQDHRLAQPGRLTTTLRICRFVCLLGMVLLIAGCATTSKTPKQEAATVEGARQQAEAAYLAKDYQQVRQILEPLAEKGDAAAQYIIGYMYYYGQGVEANLALARVWISRAADQGHSKARVALDQLDQAAQTTPAQKPLKVETISEPPAEVIPPRVDMRDSQPAPVPESASEPAPAEAAGPTEPEIEPAVSKPVQAMQPAPWTKTAKPEMPSASQVRNGSWILAQPATNYTIQLLAARDEQAVIEFIKQHNITAEAAYYAFTRKGESWFGVVYGSFASSSQAKSALEGMDASLRKQSPWIRVFGDIQRIAR